MTEHEQGIAIAQACWGESSRRPNWFPDLNAMHEVEKWLEANRPNLCGSYANELMWVIAPKNGMAGQFRHINATAAQRAEAFLRVMELWKP